MLTMLRYFVPDMLLKYYGVMVDWCIANAKYYSEINMYKERYWAKKACKYLLKELDLLAKKTGL